ncbi:MAG: acetyl-CoA acetyltransferase [Candidatus Altiarchaeales archaeon ex4484_96]|nr:MAG: acetyl-CoA acetyltransferase [Candidatus Altiarchaeales archaeon ex4484_96]
MSSRVAVIGVGITDFGELWDESFRSLITKAGTEAINDSGLEGEMIDAMYIGSMSPGLFSSQEHVSSLVADHAGLKGIPATRVEAACSSGALALRESYLSIKSGEMDYVVAGGVEKMTDIPSNSAAVTLMGAGDQEWEAFKGATFPGLYALMAQRHMYKYGTTLKQISQVSVKSHDNAALNPKAQFRFRVSLEQVMNSTPIAEPLRLLHCSPITDGAAAVVLASEEKARELTDNPVWISASSCSTDTIALHDRDSISQMDAAVRAGNEAYRKAGVKPSDIDFAEVHDCFAIAEIMAIEALGFCKLGGGGRLTEDDETSLSGRIPINTSGGLKGKGHPVGATGIAQVVEAVSQLRGEAGKRQVDDARLGLTHNVGGSGGTCVVHILSNE